MAVERRTVLKGMLAAGASAATLKMPAVHAQGSPFKIGLLTVKTGPLAQGGIQMEQGIATLLKEKGSTLAGRKVELLVADTGGNPAGAKTKAQELIERDKVNVILGPLAAFELLAITDYVRENATPLISLAAAEDVTQRKTNPFVIRPFGDVGAVPPCHGRLRRQGDEVSSGSQRSRTTSPSATSRCPASSACSRTAAARW